MPVYISETSASDIIESLNRIIDSLNNIANEDEANNIHKECGRIIERIKIKFYGHPRLDNLQSKYRGI